MTSAERTDAKSNSYHVFGVWSLECSSVDSLPSGRSLPVAGVPSKLEYFGLSKSGGSRVYGLPMVVLS